MRFHNIHLFDRLLPNPQLFGPHTRSTYLCLEQRNADENGRPDELRTRTIALSLGVGVCVCVLCKLYFLVAHSQQRRDPDTLRNSQGATAKISRIGFSSCHTE